MVGRFGGAVMAGRQLHKLSARKVEILTEPGRHSDGGGLYLTIEMGEHARRAWVFMYRERGTGRRKELGLGAAKGPNRAGLTVRGCCKPLMHCSKSQKRTSVGQYGCRSG